RVLFEFGLLGLVVLASVLVAVGRASRSIPDSPFRAVAVWGGVSLLIQATFIDIFEASKIAEPYWLILGVGIAFSLAERKADLEQPKHERGSARVAARAPRTPFG